MNFPGRTTKLFPISLNVGHQFKSNSSYCISYNVISFVVVYIANIHCCSCFNIHIAHALNVEKCWSVVNDIYQPCVLFLPVMKVLCLDLMKKMMMMMTRLSQWERCSSSLTR